MLDIAPVAREKGVAVRVQVGAEVIAEGDPLAVERILTTLMRNAVNICARRAARSQSALLHFADLSHFTVEDNGLGIAAENLARLGRPVRTGLRRHDQRHEGIGGSASPSPPGWSNCMAERCALQVEAFGEGGGGAGHPAESPARIARGRALARVA